MPRVNYVVECREFQKFAVKNRLTANEFMLWHALFELFNREAKGAWWPDDYLTLANSVVLAQTSFGAGDSACDILFRARKGLVKHGLIRYRKGKRNALMPQYAMNYFSVEKEENLNENGAENAPASLDKYEKIEFDAGKTLVKEAAEPLGKPPAKALKNPINLNTDGKPETLHTVPAGGKSDAEKRNSASLLEILRDLPDGLLFDSAWQTSAKARGAVAQRLLDSYEGEVDSPDAWDDLCEVMRRGLPPDAILRIMPFRPVFSQLLASLRALCHVSVHGSGQTAALIKQYKNNP
ncbi:MAG: hypothetical protein QM308_02975 [Bacillota bacterium]|nr:hypothetical protein [Bacillota bacterium]